MALCLAASLIERSGFDADDQMKRYVRWWKEGYMCSTGSCFDIGNTIRRALARYIETGEPFSGSTDPRAAGNGSIMRLAPVPIFFYPDRGAAVHYSDKRSRTTHGAQEYIAACRLFGDIIFLALAAARRGGSCSGANYGAKAIPEK
jgi:ADP-ribosyl-[dinitrogen reductase] hydrolase